jgi:hypothetical protein
MDCFIWCPRPWILCNKESYCHALVFSVWVRSTKKASNSVQNAVINSLFSHDWLWLGFYCNTVKMCYKLLSQWTSWRRLALLQVSLYSYKMDSHFNVGSSWLVFFLQWVKKTGVKFWTHERWDNSSAQIL